tara:strand:+ start:376 stop:690 length:315 start_codon:yes stop_codon:yes gene_type:complete
MSSFVLANGTTAHVNISGADYSKLLSGEWKLGWVVDNVGLEDETNDTFYETQKHEGPEGETTIRCFKNKVPLKTEDGATCLAHIIHWVPTSGFFCATFSTFWDQ